MDDAARTPITTRLKAAFQWVDLGGDSTHEVSDVSGWWRDGDLLNDLGPALAGLAGDPPPTVIIGPETSGFLLGPLVARSLGVGFVEAYKDGRGRVADQMARAVTAPDYRGRIVTLSVRSRLLGPTDRVLLVDDWTATGAQLAALRTLVAGTGAHYLGAAVIVDGCSRAVSADLRVRSLLRRHDLDEDT